MSLAHGYFLVGAIAVLISLQDKGLAPLGGLLVTLALILIGAIANRKGDRPYQEKDKSFYWHKTPEDGSYSGAVLSSVAHRELFSAICC
jgi:flagellin-like protein